MNPPESIPDPADRQPRLFSDAELDESHQEEPTADQAGRFTAAAFLQRHPDKYQLVIDYLGAGIPKLHIARMLQCSVHTILAIEEYNPQPIARARDKQMARLAAASGLALEAIMEDLADPDKRDKIPAGTKGVLFGILHDKHAVASGQPTQIIAHLKARPGHDEAAAYAQRMAAAETAETGPPPYDVEEMGLPGPRVADKRPEESSETGQDGGVTDV